MPSPLRWWSCRHRLRRNTLRRGLRYRTGSPTCRGRAAWRSYEPLLGERLGEFVEAAEVDAVAHRRQLEARHVDGVELFGAFGACGDPRCVLDGFGEQAGEIGVGQLDSGLGQTRAHRVGVDVALRG